MPGLRGFAGIDVVWHPSRGPVVIEVNPRLTVAYAGLSAALGGNLAAALLAAHGVRVQPGKTDETGETRETGQSGESRGPGESATGDRPTAAAARAHDARPLCGVRP
jgi:predicted ATP-grasp superfamily ATP-dependent carboligase